MTAVVGMIALVLVLYVGLVDRPGSRPARSRSQSAGSSPLLGCVLIVVGGAMRASGTERPRKPPGVL